MCVFVCVCVCMCVSAVRVRVRARACMREEGVPDPYIEDKFSVKYSVIQCSTTVRLGAIQTPLSFSFSLSLPPGLFHHTKRKHVVLFTYSTC